MKKIIFMLILLLVVVFLSLSFYLFNGDSSFLLSVNARTERVSSANIYCFVSPSCVKADEQEVSRLTCFCLNSRGLGVPNIDGTVNSINADSAHLLTIKTIQGITDEAGKFIIDFTSKSPATHELRVSCGDTIGQTIQRVCFQ